MPYDFNTAKQKVTDYATSKYGRGPANDAEWAQIGQGINLQNIDDNALQTAYGNVDRLAASYGAKPAQTAPQPAPPPQQNPVTQTPQGAVTFQTGGGLQAPAPAPAAGAVPPSGVPAPNVPPNLQNIVPNLFTGSQPSPLDLQAQQAISDLLTRGGKPATLDDPNIRNVSEVHRVQNQRGAERLRAAAAERAAQSGQLESGAFDTEALKYDQDARFNNAAFDANLLREEDTARRNELQAAIRLAQQTGQFDKAQQLQTQLALLDGALRERGMGIQQGLGQGDLGLRLLATLLSDEQFNTGAGLDMAKFQALLNQNAINSILGGGF